MKAEDTLVTNLLEGAKQVIMPIFSVTTAAAPSIEAGG